MAISPELQATVAHAGELMLRAAAVIATLPEEEQRTLNDDSGGEISDFLTRAIFAAAKISPEFAKSLLTHPPSPGFAEKAAAAHLNEPVSRERHKWG